MSLVTYYYYYAQFRLYHSFLKHYQREYFLISDFFCKTVDNENVNAYTSSLTYFIDYFKTVCFRKGNGIFKLPLAE